MMCSCVTVTLNTVEVTLKYEILQYLLVQYQPVMMITMTTLTQIRRITKKFCHLNNISPLYFHFQKVAGLKHMPPS